MRITQAQKIEAIAQLKKHIEPSTEIVVIMHSVSRSGMQRKLSAYVVGEDKRLVWLNGYIATAGIASLDKNQKIIANGCGMDMLFDLAHSVKCALFGFEVAGKNQQYYSIY
jgi:hypothetical protein